MQYPSSSTVHVLMAASHKEFDFKIGSSEHIVIS